jgi:hypothetical protein
MFEKPGRNTGPKGVTFINYELMNRQQGLAKLAVYE